MTIREAVIESYRERGYTEEEIVEAVAFSDRTQPGCVQSTYAEVPAGREREFIDNFKALAELPTETLLELYEHAKKRVMQDSAKN